MAISIAERNQRITVQQNETVTDRIGNHTSAWTDFLELWANVTITASTEGTEAGVTSMRQTMKAIVLKSAQTAALCSNRHPVRRRGLQRYRCDAVLHQRRSGADHGGVAAGKAGGM